MKKITLLLFALTLVFACSKKTTPSKSAAENKNQEIYLAGKNTYTLKCGKCHELFPAEKGNIDFWNIWVERMAPKAKLTEVEKSNVLEYLRTDCLK